MADGGNARDERGIASLLPIFIGEKSSRIIIVVDRTGWKGFTLGVKEGMI